MNALLRRACDGRGDAANAIVRVLVGAVFFSEGIQKLLYADALGVGRFAVTAPFVGVVEIVAGAGARSVDARWSGTRGASPLAGRSPP